jgi:tRNA (adenine22-N1)-methyltransferase
LLYTSCSFGSDDRFETLVLHTQELALPHLDLRLKTVAKQIQANCHVDIGSDHGNLLVSLLKSGRIQAGIAIENKRQPFENSRCALIGLAGEARFADGLNGLAAGEADSLSICGMGGGSIDAILREHPERIPPKVVLQPNRDEQLVRRWAIDSGYHLVDEHIVWGHWPYAVMAFQSASGNDPVYHDGDQEAALMFGPINLKRSTPRFIRRLNEERQYLLNLDGLSDASRYRLELIQKVLHRKQDGTNY